MRQRHILIADDVDVTKIDRIRGVVERLGFIAHIARSARQAIALAEVMEFDAAAIDFDFEGERENGADIIATVRRSSRDASIACVTARDSLAFEQAQAATLAAGANAAFSSSGHFESELQLALAA